MNVYRANQVLLFIKNNPGVCKADIERYFQSDIEFLQKLKELECIKEGEYSKTISTRHHATGLYFNKFYAYGKAEVEYNNQSKFLGKKVKVVGGRGHDCPNINKIGIVTKHEFSSYSGIEPYTNENDWGVKGFVCEIRDQKTKEIFWSKCEFLEVL